MLALAGGSRADVTVLAGTANERLRVGRYRVIFRREGESIVVLRLAPRGGAYLENDMEPQLIRDPDGKAVYAILPFDEYERLVRAAEERDDIAALAAPEEGERVPAELVFRISHGENPVRVWRDHRELRQIDLATRAGISQGYLSDIEAGKVDGSFRVVIALARALEIEVDELVSPEA